MKKIYFLTSLLAATILLKGQDQFTNNGNLKFHAGSNISFYGNFTNNGTFKDSSQMITFKGSSQQMIGGSSVSTFNNITLNNASGAALSANENLKGILTITTGTFATSGYTFTLLSDASGTACIGPITGGFAGPITMQRFLGTGPTDWRFLASPVNGARFTDWQDNFVISGIPNSNYAAFPFTSVYGYDETVPGTWDYGYTPPADISDKMFPGLGYWAYVGPTPVTVDVTGPPATYHQTFPVSYTPSAGTDNDGWFMAGNPYPCAIDWSSNAWTKSNINNAIYIWNPQLQQYASWVAGIGVNGGSNVIASSQAFWVQANAANPVLECDENVKTTLDRSFIREANQSYSTDFLKLTLNGNGYSDETYLRFDNSATGNYDTELDARKVFTSSPGVPSLSTLDLSGTDMSISSLPPVTAHISIPVKTLVSASGTYTIARDSASSTFPNYCIVLEDLATGIKTDLSQTASYTFSIADTTVSARFILHVGSSTVNVQTQAANCHGTSDGLAIASASGSGPVDYIWTNANNDTVRTSLQSMVADTLQHMAAGSYTVWLVDATSMCGAISQSFSISEPDAVHASFTLSADTLVLGVNDTLFTSNTSSGAAGFTWSFGDGSIDSTQAPTHLFTQPGNYTISLLATQNSCSDSVTATIVVTTAPAVHLHEAIAANSIKVYPNPSHGQFNITLPAGLPGDLRVEVYNLLGATLINAPLSNNSNAIDMSGYAQGIYSYRIFAENSPVITGQLILE